VQVESEDPQLEVVFTQPGLIRGTSAGEVDVLPEDSSSEHLEAVKGPLEITAESQPVATRPQTAPPITETSDDEVSVWRSAVLLGAVIPLVFGTTAGICSLGAMLLENVGLREAFTFMVAAVTGGAIQIQSVHNPFSPQASHTKVVSTVMASIGVGLYGFLIALLGSLIPNNITDRMASTSIAKGLLNLVALALATTMFLLMIAVVFGGLLIPLESWSFHTSWKTVAFVALGGGIPIQIGAANSHGGGILLVLLGLWSIEMFALVIALASNTCVHLVEQLGLLKPVSLLCMLTRFAVFTSAVVPLVLLSSMALVGIGISASMSIDFLPAFWISLPAVSGGATTVYTMESVHMNWMHDLLLISSSSVGFFTMCLCIGICGVMAGPIIDRLLFWRCCPCISVISMAKMSVLRSILMLAVATCVCTPVCVGLFGACIGGLVAWVEEWPFKAGFWWSVAAQLGGGMNLAPDAITTTTGRLLGVVMAAWSIGVASISVGFSSSTAVEPLLQFIVAHTRCQKKQQVIQSI